MVVYCKDCGIELSKETVQVDCAPHTAGKAAKENIVESTHTVGGSYALVTKCVDCGKVMSSEDKVTDPVGHNYSKWDLIYNETSNEFILVGNCSCDEDGNVCFINESNGLNVEVDSSTPSCIAKTYIVTYKYNDKVITKTYEVQPDSHAFFEIEVEGVGKLYLSVDSQALYDEVYGVYYDVDYEGIYFVKDENAEENVDNVWNSDGFAIGVFKCPRCEEWYGIRVYSAEYDTRLSSN